MSFSRELKKIGIKSLAVSGKSTTKTRLERALHAETIRLSEFLALLSPVASENLEILAQRSRSLTLSRFGRVIQLYAPLYLSSYCLNNCLYCGFRAENPIERKILSPDEVVKEARFLLEQGFRNVLLVAGEDPHNCNLEYLCEVVSRVHEFIPMVSLEIGPQTIDDYTKLRKAGAEGVIIYQETYDPDLYHSLHGKGNKSDYAWRLETPGRVAQAGFHRVGIGALFGLGDPMEEAIALFLHAGFLLKHHWSTRVTISFPRLRPAKGAITTFNPVDDRTLAQVICAFRIAFPEIGIVLSTREEPSLRDGMVNIGVTQLSAGSRTEPGGYLEPAKDKEQFHVEDGRSPGKIAEMLAAQGYEPVWKDWEASLV